MRRYSYSLSIVIITYNGADLTDRLMGSLWPLIDKSDDTEIVIVDNHSTDSTRTILDRWKSKLTDRLTVIYAEKNLGVAGGRTIGTESARGEMIMYLDNDTIVSAEAVNRLRSYLETHPSCGLVAPALRSLSGELQESAKPFPGIGVKVRNMVAGHKSGSNVSYGDTDTIHPYYVIGACQLFRRATYDSVGGLDTRIFYGPEDADFCERIRQTGLTIDYLQNVTIVHEWQRATRRSLFSRLSREHIKGLIHFYIKHKRFF